MVGVWLMHCHLEVHTSWGLKMAWIVLDGQLPNQKLPPPPLDLPKCWRWVEWERILNFSMFFSWIAFGDSILGWSVIIGFVVQIYKHCIAIHQWRPQGVLLFLRCVFLVTVLIGYLMFLLTYAIAIWIKVYWMMISFMKLASVYICTGAGLILEKTISFYFFIFPI